MGSLSKAERFIRKQDNERIVSTIKESVKAGAMVTKYESRKEFGIDGSLDGRRRMDYLFLRTKEELAEDGMTFKCIGSKTDGKWGILTAREHYEAVAEASYQDLKARAKTLNNVVSEAATKGILLQQIQLQRLGYGGNL